MEEDMTIIKSLIAISSGGLLLSRIPREFFEMNGSPLNFRKYGFNSVEEMLRSSKEVELRSSPDGPVCRVHDAKMSHVTSLVERQRKPKLRKNKAQRSRSAYYHTSRGGCFGVKRGSTNSPIRRPFYPSNRMSYDRSRPQSVGPSASSKNHYQSQSSTVRYQPKCSSVSHANNSNYDRSQRPEQRPVQSSAIGSSVGKLKTSREWSSGSSGRKEQPPTVPSSIGWTSRSAAEVKIPKPSSSPSSQGASKAAGVHPHCPKPNSIFASTQAKTFSNKSSSDWSSDSGSASSRTGHPKKTLCSSVKCSSNPVQNGVVSSTSKLVQNASETSDWSTDSSDHEFDQYLSSSANCSKPSTSGIRCTAPSVDPVYMGPPLMVGGVGRGRSRPQVDSVKPGNKDNKPHRSPSKEVIVTGSPCKRETSTTVTNGLSSIVIKVRNEPAVQGRVPKKLKTLPQVPTIASYQFIGDFLLQRVAKVSLGLKFPEKGGLCHSRATIMGCLEEIKRNRSGKPVVLMIGMTDILEGATFEEMKHRMTLLLEKLSTRNLVLLTLPVLPIFLEVSFERELSVLERFNKWLLSLKLQNTIETEQFLYCDAPFYIPRYGTSGLETFSEEGCWVVWDEIMGANCF